MTEETILEKPKGTNKTILIGIVTVTVVFLVIGYFGYQYYQTKQYIEKIMPMFRSYELLSQDAEKIANNSGGKRFMDIFEECKRVKQSYKDLKLRIVENNTTTQKTEELQRAFNELIDLQVESVDTISTFFQAQMTAQTSSEILNQWKSNSFISMYNADMIEKQEDELKKAKSTYDSARWKYGDLANNMKQPRERLYNLLGISLPQ